MRVLVAEPSAPISAALRKFLMGTGDVQVAHYLDEAMQDVRANNPDVLIASVSGQFDGEALCALVRKQGFQVGIVLVYPPEEENAVQRSVAVGADSCLVGPLKKAGVLAAVHTVMVIRTLRADVGALEAQIKILNSAPKAPEPVVARGTRPATQPGAAAVDDQFFKNFLLMEIKRSKRYQYPVSLLVVALDHLGDMLQTVAAPEVVKAGVRAEVMASITGVIRDIDVAYPFADNRYLVFLAHTPGDGAKIVAARIQSRLGKLQAFPGATVSVGLSVYEPRNDPKASVSFGSLVKEATAALGKAMNAGGNAIEASASVAVVKKSRISLG